MAQINFTIPDAAIQRVIDAYVVYFNFDKNKIGAETQSAFTKRMIAVWIKSITAEYEIRVDADLARPTIIADVETNVVIT